MHGTNLPRLAALAALGGCAALAGCAAAPPPRPAVPPPRPVSPFADAPVSFLIRGAFTRGERVIVRVCLNPDRSIASADVLQSSGDRRFDERALDWARRVRLRSAPTKDAPQSSCGTVRVELRDLDEPLDIGGSPNLLG